MTQALSLAEHKTTKEIDKMDAEIDKLRAETRKVLRETVVIPFLAGAAVMGGLTALVGAIAAIVVKLWVA